MNFFDIVEASYIVYMYNFFKTSKSIHHPLEYYFADKPLGEFLKHPIDTGEYENKICPLGNVSGWLIGLWILARKSLIIRYGGIVKKIIQVQ